MSLNDGHNHDHHNPHLPSLGDLALALAVLNGISPDASSASALVHNVIGRCGW
jgi:hypothetical protein